MILSHLCCGQSNALAFNKGLLLNAAVREMSHRVPIDCIIFHDVDLVPVGGDEVYYDCSAYPRHLTVKVDKFRYRWVELITISQD